MPVAPPVITAVFPLSLFMMRRRIGVLYQNVETQSGPLDASKQLTKDC
jgi:hypothetical protein